MSKIIIDCDSIPELLDIITEIQTGSYKWKICVYDNQSLIDHYLKHKQSQSVVYNIFWCEVVNKFKL